MYRRGHRKKGTMNEDLKKIFEIANFMNSLNNQKRELFEEFNQSLFYYKDGHVFKATSEFISFISALMNNSINSIVLLDVNNEPYNVEDVKQFLEDIISVYVEATNSYYYSYKKLTQSRNIESLTIK